MPALKWSFIVKIYMCLILSTLSAGCLKPRETTPSAAKPKSAPPVAPVLSAKPEVGSITLNWTASPGAKKYVLEQQTLDGGISQNFGIAGETVETNASIAVKTVGIVQNFRVYAETADGVRSEPSQVIRASACDLVACNFEETYKRPDNATMGIGLNPLVYANHAFVGFTLGGNEFRSTDGGETWQQSTGLDAEIHSIATDGNVIVAVGTGAYVSTDGGASWTKTDDRFLSTVVYLNHQFIASSYSDLSNAFFSYDGQTWRSEALVWSDNKGYTFNETEIAFGHGTYVMAIAENSAGYAISPDAIHWTVSTTHFATSVAFGNGVFVMQTDAGELLNSIDGQQWSLSTTKNSDRRGLHFVNGYFFSPSGAPTSGAGGSFLISTDGQAWSQDPVGFSSGHDQVAFGDGHYVFSHYVGSILTSTARY